MIMSEKKAIFRIGIKNYPAAHGGVEAATYNFIHAARDKYNFTVFTVWENPSVVNNEVGGVKVFQLAKGWISRFFQIRNAVQDKKNTILHFHMEIFIPLAMVFSLLGYNVVSSIHGRNWKNPKISPFICFFICIADLLGVNIVKRTIFVSKVDWEAMKKYTWRKIYWIPNGSVECSCINEHPTKDMVFFGRISIQKNLENLIIAADKYKRSLDIYGPFDEREVKHSARIRGLLSSSQYVHYCGKLTPEQIYPTISEYRCAVNASKSEASPNSVIEAGACGLFLYLSDIQGHRGVGYPDVRYFDPEHIELPHDERENCRSLANIRYHRENLSIWKQVERYSAVYESF